MNLNRKIQLEQQGEEIQLVVDCDGVIKKYVPLFRKSNIHYSSDYPIPSHKSNNIPTFTYIRAREYLERRNLFMPTLKEIAELLVLFCKMDKGEVDDKMSDFLRDYLGFSPKGMIRSQYWKEDLHHLTNFFTDHGFLLGETGVYIQDNPPIKKELCESFLLEDIEERYDPDSFLIGLQSVENRRIDMNECVLRDKIKTEEGGIFYSEDKTVRFVPYKNIVPGVQNQLEIEENTLVIATVGRDGARTLGRIPRDIGVRCFLPEDYHWRFHKGKPGVVQIHGYMAYVEEKLDVTINFNGGGIVGKALGRVR